MPKSGRQKLEIRISRLLGDAILVSSGRADLLRNGPVITLKQMTILVRRDQVGGVFKKPVRRDFRSALNRHQSRQLRAYTSNCRRQVCALRKLVKNYVEMPGASF